MGDLFHKEISDRFIAEVWDVMTRCPEHSFFVLTKRPSRFLKWAKSWRLLPFPNIYVGVSIEDQKTADERIPLLLQIPAAHRFISIEPMLGPVDLLAVPAGTVPGYAGLRLADMLHWAVLGGETGPKARPMHPDWIRSIRDQCQAASIPFFFKSWGTPRFPNIDISDWVSAGYNPYRGNDNNILDGKEHRQVV